MTRISFFNNKNPSVLDLNTELFCSQSEENDKFCGNTYFNINSLFLFLMSEITASLSTPDFSIPEDWQQELPGAGMFYDKISSVYKRKTNVSYLISYTQYHDNALQVSGR